MDAAAHIATDDPEVMSWDEILARYPDQYVCLLDIERPEDFHPTITRARVVGHGPTRGDAFARDRCYGKTFALRFTGKCTKPLIRPTFVFDGETPATLDALNKLFNRT